MNAPTPVGHGDLPRTTDVEHPRTRLVRSARPLARQILRRRFDLEVFGTEHFPVTGPVVVVANHIGVLDGPLMAAVGPRPVHALTKIEMFEGKMGRFLTAAGQIPVERHHADTVAVRSALRVLRDGGVVGIFPEGGRGAGKMNHAEPGAAYLAIASGAAVVPLAMLGTRSPGGTLGSVPPKGTRMSLSYGEPLHFGGHGWPRRRDEVAQATEEIRQAIMALVAESERRTGIALPGPVPPKIKTSNTPSNTQSSTEFSNKEEASR